MKILILTAGLEQSGPAKQLTLLAANLPRERFTVRICTLRPITPWGEELRRAGVEVEALSWQRLFDARSLLRLRRIGREFAPDVVHAWGLAGLRMTLLARPRRARVLLSAPTRGDRTTRLGRFDRWLIASCVERVVVGGAAEAESCRRLGVPAAKVVEAGLGVAPPPPPAVAPDVLRQSLGLSEGARLLVCVGPLESARGFRDAIWAFDILQFVYDDLHLLLIGTGPAERRLRDFAAVTRSTGRAHFLGQRSDRDELLHAAEVVWVPSRADRGLNTALEAMAAGRPVVGVHRPALAEVVEDGVTGVLVPGGDQAALARETRLLLDDPERRARLGEAARQRAASHFGVERLVQRFAEVYGA